VSNSGTGDSVQLRPKQTTRRPRQFKVLLHNDHYTSMEFVVYVLQAIFDKNGSDAQRIMLNVHQQGIGVAGVYPASIAETKIDQVHTMAETEGFPLKCSMEPA
jgi:ATP-dependent Clp protease adaptor protein ClpS